MTRMIQSIAELDAVRDYLGRIGASVRSLRTAVVEQRQGKYWKDISIIKFNKNGEIIADAAYEPTELEQAAIKAAFEQISFPESVKLAALPSIPPEIEEMYAQGRRDEVYEFRDNEGNFVMFQYKTMINGEKNYLPFTFWNDGVWRRMEPDDKLPIYNIERAMHASTVFLHEGAKGAAICQAMVDRKTPEMQKLYESHPWAAELATGVHIGWIGGALNPMRTDWGMLKKCGVKRVVIVSDNDPPGRAAIPLIAYRLNVPTFSIEFTNEFPSGFDLGDPWPRDQFTWCEEDKRRVYTGKPMTAYLHPATWATELIAGSKPKAWKLRESFRDQWVYAERHELFVNKVFTNIMYTPEQLNTALAPFYHGKNIARMIVADYTGRTVKLAYRPDKEERMIIDRDQPAINLHVPSNVKALPGNAKPWTDFLEYMFPIPDDRKQVERWVATLIARPDVRMGYALLLMSEAQGVGKTTLGNAILEPIVGSHNTDQTTERDIVDSQFTDWIAEKRLVIVNEIYSGHSWKAYHKLKSFVTDTEVKVNKKFQTPYTVDNWAHIFACSNSKTALKMDDDDRRWLCPEVTELPWPRERFAHLYQWLKGAGLGIIVRWAQEYGDYVMPGERAPMTAAKRSLIGDSLSEAGKLARDLALAMNDDVRPMAVTVDDVSRWVREDRRTRVFEADGDLKKPMKAAGLTLTGKQLKLEGRLQRLLVNKAALPIVTEWNAGYEGAADKVRASIVRPQDVLPSRF